jgi:hypothetical protein
VAYFRTSSLTSVGEDTDTLKRQRSAVEGFAKRAGYELIVEYSDDGVKGADPVDTRPGFAAMLKHLASNGVHTGMLQQTQARDDIEAELVDLRDHPMPFFDEKGPPMSTPSENAEVLRWQKALARYDGFVFVVAEYNSSVTGVLKNALDQAYKEWGRKPFTAIGCGGTGAARAF